MTKDQRPVCSKCQTPMVRYNVPHTDDREQAWRLACSCKHSAVSEVVPSNRITLAEWREKELTYVIGALATALELEDDEQRDALCDIREWAKNRLKAQLPDETQSAAPKQRLRTLRKTVEHFARSFQQDGHASSETVKELFEAAAVLESLEKRPDETTAPTFNTPQFAGLAFRHWSKDPAVPYAGCRCDTCSSVEPFENPERNSVSQGYPQADPRHEVSDSVAAKVGAAVVGSETIGSEKASECRGCKEGWHRQGSWHWDSIGHMHECTSQNGDEKHG